MNCRCLLYADPSRRWQAPGGPFSEQVAAAACWFQSVVSHAGGIALRDSTQSPNEISTHQPLFRSLYRLRAAPLWTGQRRISVPERVAILGAFRPGIVRWLE